MEAFKLLTRLVFLCHISTVPNVSTNSTQVVEIPNFTSLHRIVGGDEAIPHEFPWIAYIYVNVAGVTRTCVGSILARKWVITAAHCCLQQMKFYRVVGGVHNRRTHSRRHQIKHLENIIIHPQFDGAKYQNDIAMLKMTSEFNFNSYIKPIEMIPPNIDPGFSTVVAGWGSEYFGAPRVSDLLRKVASPIVGKGKCVDLYRSVITISSHHFCTGGIVGKSSCAGDSGAPVMCRSKMRPFANKYYLCGIVSGAKGCAEERYPQVNVNISHFRHWISHVMDSDIHFDEAVLTLESSRC